MNKQDLKKLIKPIIKECIHEVIIEEGVLSKMITEVARGLQVAQPVQQPIVEQQRENQFIKQKSQETNQKLMEHKKKLMEAVGKGGYNGVNIFENVQPMREDSSSSKSSIPNPIDVLDPNGTGGINISNIPGMGKWGNILKKMDEQKE